MLLSPSYSFLWFGRAIQLLGISYSLASCSHLWMVQKTYAFPVFAEFHHNNSAICWKEIKCLIYAWFVAWHNFLIPLRLGWNLLTWFQPYYLPSIGTFGYGSLQTGLGSSACPLSKKKATLGRADPALMYLTSDQHVCPQHLIYFSYTMSIWLIIPVRYL